MSAICVLVPTVIAGWPAISAAVAGAAAALGLSSVRESVKAASRVSVQQKATSVEVELENSEVVGEALSVEEEIVLTRGDIRIRIYRDERGQCCVCVEGVGKSKQELKAMGERISGKITQIFVYNKMMTELKARGFSILDETVARDESVHIHVSRMV